MNTDDRELRLPRTQLMARLLKFMRPVYGAMAFSCAMRCLKLLGDTVVLAVAVGSVFHITNDPRVLWSWVGYLTIAAGAMGLFHYLEQWSGHYVAFRVLAMMRNEFYDKLEPLAPAGTQKLQSGDAVARVINDVELIEPFYAHTIAPVLAALVVPSVLVAYLYGIHPDLALTLIPFLVFVIFVVPIASDHVGRSASHRVRRAFGRVNAYATDSLQGVRDTLAFGHGEERRQELWARGKELEEAKSRLVGADALQRALMEATVVAAILAVAWVGTRLHEAGSIDILRDVPVVIAVTVTAFAGITGLTNVMNDFNTAMICADRLYEMMDAVSPVAETSAASPAEVQPTVSFDAVTFSYGPRLATRDGERVDGGGDKVLNGLSLTAPAGRNTAIVGASGAGKSTLVNLLMRFWDTESGSVRIGGHDVRDFTLEGLRRHIAVVSQRTFVFNTSIRDNIRMGRPDATQAEVEEAARLARLTDFIATLPEGYDSQVGEGGSKLSGGQRQRIAIARALLKDAPILVLDEATSSLDVENEAEVNTAIAELMKGRTVITIAHRLSTVAAADEILVLSSGKLAERGTHEALLEAGGVYARLFELQQDEIGSRVG